MIITHHGAGSFRLSVGNITIALGPVAKGSEWKHSSFGADIVLVPLHHKDANGVGEVTYGGKNPFVIDGPGEYEVSDVLVKGYPAISRLSGEEQYATMYLIRMEKMTLLYLGPISRADMHPDLKEILEDVDILFVPVGGGSVLATAEAHKVTVAVEPHVVIPMCYDKEQCNVSLHAFEKKSAGDVMRVGEKWTVKAKDIETFTQAVVLFQ